MQKQILFVIFFTIFFLTFIYHYFSSVQQQTSRDFSKWLSPSTFKNLLLNVNPSIDQNSAQRWLIDITKSAQKYPQFCNSGNEKLDKKEFAAFLSIVGAETSFSGSFPCVQENGCPNCQACSYNSKGQECDQDPKKQYYGRGPLQLSWNYNYADFSQSYFGDDRLISDPTLLNDNTELCWASALWFWMQKHDFGGWCMPQAAWNFKDTCDKQCPKGPNGCSNPNCSNDHWIAGGKESPHNAIVIQDSMDTVINIINGGYDCCPTSIYFNQYGHTIHRIWWYADILKNWGEQLPWNQLKPVPIKNCKLAQNKIDCSRMQSDTCYYQCCNSL